jgi:hypothetical protein
MNKAVFRDVKQYGSCKNLLTRATWCNILEDVILQCTYVVIKQHNRVFYIPPLHISADASGPHLGYEKHTSHAAPSPVVNLSRN